ncbi:response regulator [Robiginitomaculum antarcticum]|uniref:response regulator n=1 Tax=Robiginitomaculum antarcticum TaxID=437507 RepID=UPI00036B4086|nr:response regulator [Robiginitomaculum antarcticum]
MLAPKSNISLTPQTEKSAAAPKDGGHSKLHSTSKPRSENSLTQSKPVSKTANMLNVLVAEDNYTNRVLTRTLLQRCGFNPTLVNNGYEVIGACRIQKFDLILMDIDMPQLNGIEATQYLRRHSGANQTTIIVALTAYDSPSEKYTYQHSGVDHVIAKPLRPDALAHILETHFEIEHNLPRDPDFKISQGSCVIDASIIGTLAAQYDISDLKSVFKSFWAIADGLYKDMAAAFDQWNDHELGQAGHALKGAAANIGLSEISGIAATLSKASPAQAGPILAQLDAAISRGKKALRVFVREMS